MIKTKAIMRSCFWYVSAIIAFLALISCGEEKNPRMYWHVSSQDEENVEISYDVYQTPQIEITVSSEGGECRLSCSNYKTLAFRTHSRQSNVHEDFDCQYYAEITAPGIIRIRFDKMPQKDNEITSYFTVDGAYGEVFNNTVIKVTRLLHNKAYPK